jgi:protein translocase SecG subunit
MGIEEKIWSILGLAIIAIILATDPKNSTSGVDNGKLTVMFSSITEGQKFLRKLTWGFISIFFVLTIVISCQN